MRKMRKGNKLNKKGFSLLELLIAVIVLAIVVVPFLHSFLTSSKLNARARIKAQATTLAQNTFEGLKTETYLKNSDGDYIDAVLPHLENIVYQFAFPTVGTEKNFHILPAAVMADAEVGIIPVTGAVTDLISSTDGGVTYTFQEAAEYKYMFYILGAKEQGSKYDILIKMDGSPYTSSGSSNQKYNDKSFIQIPFVDSNFDAVCTKNYDVDARNDIEMKLNSQGIAFDQSREYRTITIDAVASGTDVTVEVTYSYSYKYTDGTEYQSLERTSNVYAGTIDSFRNIYLYYYPLYTNSAQPQDTIIFNNNVAGSPFETELYLIKQEDQTMNRHDLKVNENQYKVAIHVNDSEVGEGNPCSTHIRTNIGTNLYHVYDTTGTTMEVPNQGRYYHNSSLNPYTGANAIAKFDIRDLYNMDTKTAYLNAEIKVFSHTLTGAVTESSFDGKEVLVSMDGSVIN